MSRLWVPGGGGADRYVEDLPRCCRGYAPREEESFACRECGAVWEAVRPPELDPCGFAGRRERRGAA
ncbi:hypothetical protein E0L93_06780 [Rubrobacter taiwanensis]|jgi:hypothetical protein|uniref:Uncharacterized protein n=1 Tax=Rubrobacter taiwanensis TaxID=185139 RepID=A0A4R1BL15_9ACTN|nr:hypothetical protein [Rubrobacter taiwanensis]TCJ18115.1 hypothetical protein E0L93_06780 [Rubrobacter taiwanensis]